MTDVEVMHGKLKGSEKDGIYVFKGIPYAFPPMGEFRWQPPQDPWPWTGILDASEFGKWAPQNKSAMDAIMGAEEGEQSEGCLTLNVWTPGMDSAKRPVMVWIHGGGFTIGSGAQGVYEGKTLARHGDVVIVTINYRLGIFGFANLKEATGGRIPATGNEGLQDQAKALEWVQDNIDLFGGDPNNVTIFGESAGGMSTGGLLALPDAKGLFHKAIPQSGSCHTAANMETGALVGEAIMKATGLDAEGLSSASVEVLLRAQRHIEGNKVEGYPLSKLGSLPFRPVIDGSVLPDLPINSVRAGGAANIPIMAGSTADEWRLFGALSPAIKGLTEETMNTRLGYLIGEAHIPGLVGAYKEGLAGRCIEPTPPEVFMAIQTDRIFRIPAIRLLEGQRPHNENVFTYIFDWKSPAARGALGATHAVELAYVFGTHTKPGAEKFYGSGPAAATLASATMDAWSTFARDGSPGWESYDADTRATRIMGENCRTENAPLELERAAWDEVPDDYLGSL
ncbi:MAG: carboxylesterase/lipase family protein [Porticoccaceae bacterium]|nr:carboxylesterase/lipase family protein [Porticoccaceae bacterium]